MEFNIWLQSRLAAHGFTSGAVDGYIGPKTIAALKEFERVNGLTIDGTADPEVVKRLRADALKRPASALPPGVTLPVDRNDDTPPKRIDAFASRVWPRQPEVPKFFGDPGSSLVTIQVPFDMVLAWDTSIPARKMTLHKKVAASAERALHVVGSVYSAKERAALGINKFGGSFNVRKMRGGERLSMHAYAIAIDFDPERNQLSWGRDKARLAQADAIPFWRAWEDEGWVSLGRARNFDWMHVQAARL